MLARCNILLDELVIIIIIIIIIMIITAVGLRLSDEAIRIAVAHRLGCKACEPHTCVCGKAVNGLGCMDSPAAEAPQDNNVTAISTTSCGEQLNGYRSRQSRNQLV